MLKMYRTPATLFALLSGAIIGMASWATAQASDKPDTSPTPDTYPDECQSTSKILPAWIPKEKVEQGEIAITSYTNSQWYQAWERTTLSRCTDLTTVTTLAGKRFPVKTIFWRSDRMPLFRGGRGRTPDNIFKWGFYPWKYDGNLDLVSGSGNKDSSLVNTGYSPDYLFDSAVGVATGKNQGYLIDAPGGINQDQTDVGSNALLLHGKGVWPRNELVGERTEHRNVVVFPGGIRTEFIKGEFALNTKNHHLEYRPNPNYAYPHPQADEFDLVLPSQAYGEDKSILSASPVGELVGGITHRYKRGTDVTVSVANETTPHMCWHVNAEERGGAAQGPLILKTKDEHLPVAVVFRSECHHAPARALSASQAADLGY